jgi:hypothetical protein
MKYLSLFNDFDKVEEAFNFDSGESFQSKINQMLFLKQNGCVVGMDLNEFKSNFRSNALLETRGYDGSEAILEKAYSVYELGMFSEAKSHWFENRNPVFENSRGVISYLEFEGNILLFKDGEAFMISETSLNLWKSHQPINESIFEEVFGKKLNESWSWTDNPIVSGFQSAVDWTNTNIVEPTSKIIQDYVITPLKSVWDALSAGAQKLYDFSKKVLNAIGTFISENWQDIAFYITVVLQVIAGVIAFVPAAGQIIGPILLIVAGSLQVGLGFYDVYEGVEITKECPIDPLEKAAPEFTKGILKLLGGSVSVLLGIHDIATSPKAAVPGAAMTSTAVAVPAKAWAESAASKLATTGAAIGLFETVIKYIIELAGSAGTKAIAKQGASYTAKKGALIAGEALTKAGSDIIGKKLGDKAQDAVVPILCMAGQNALGWLWDVILGAVSGIGELLNGLLDLPTKVSEGIKGFNEKYSGSTFGYVVGGALNSFVDPVTKVLSWFSENKVKPVVKPVTDWMVSLKKSNKSIKNSVESKPDLKSALKGEGIPKPEGKIPSEEYQITDSDKENLAKIQTSQSGQELDRVLAKNWGFFERERQIILKHLEKVKQRQKQLFIDKFPALAKKESEGKWRRLKNGALCFDIKNYEEVEGDISFYNNGRYLVKSGPNENTKGEYSAKNEIKLVPPEGGFKTTKKKEGKKKDKKKHRTKKNESMNFIMTRDEFFL